MFNGWKITNILDVGLCELDTADGPYNKTGYRLEHREDGFAITVGLMEYISGWSALEILYWLHEKQAIPWRCAEMQSLNKAKARAEEALNHFEELENGDFLTYKQKDSAPEWVRDMCYEAHGSGDYLPDNYIYRWIVDALEIIRECTTEDEAEERIHELEPFPYHKNLTLWLDSNILRIQYLEDAAREGAIENILSFAQYLEIQEVAFTVLNFLREAEEEEAEED